jgi:N-methylhydantoinase A
MSYRVGIDVGGTFTDYLLLGDDDIRLAHKTSSTPDDPSRAVITGLEEIGAELELDMVELLERIEVIVHGTTVTTNAALTGDGARTGLVTTAGFRDVLALRDGTREEPYNNRLPPPRPLVPRYLRLGVRERIDYVGTEIEPLDEDGIRSAAEILRAEEVEAVAISFMHSPANPGHELRALELLRELLPGVYLTASSELLPQVRLYARTSTATLNSYVGPIITSYIETLTRRLEGLRFHGVLLIMQSNGGVASPPEVARRAALSLLSGPASGPTAGLWQLEPHGLRDCITIDMGGTSFDAALVNDGQPLVMTDGEVARWRLGLPTIDIHTIGAGGGSIARVDEGGLLHVGPQSAGAVPGPACYGRGGTEPTVTDADLVLGYLSADAPLAGGLRLDRAAAEEAIARALARPLGLSTEEAAAGVYDVVNVTMATGVREVSVRRGLDPRDFPLVVAGGAGPLHAASIAVELELPLLVVPRESSIFCAAGMLMSDFKHDFVRACKAPLAELEPDRLNSLIADMVAEGRETLARERVAADAAEERAALDLRYVGQWHELTVAVEVPVDRDRVAGDFHREHDRLFGYASPEMPIDVLAARVTSVGRTVKPRVRELAGGSADPEAARTGVRPVWSPAERQLVETAVYDGSSLATGAELTGPAVVELESTTVVVPGGCGLVVDRLGAFVLHTGERGRELARRLAPETPSLAR